jgi:hypothetical protein
MPSSVTFDDRRDVVVLEYTGPLELDVVIEGGVRALTVALEHGCGVLVDMRGIVSPLAAKEITGVAQGLGDLGLQPGQRVAIFGSPFDAENAIFRRFAKRAGFEIQVLPDETDALAWVRSTDPP